MRVYFRIKPLKPQVNENCLAVVNDALSKFRNRSQHIFYVRVFRFEKIMQAQTSLLNILDLAGSEEFSNNSFKVSQKVYLGQSFASQRDDSEKNIKDIAKVIIKP